MSWKNVATPLVLIIVGVSVTLMILTAPDARTDAGAPDRNIAQQATDIPCQSYLPPDIPQRCLVLTTTPQTATTLSPTTTGTVVSTATTPSATLTTPTTSAATATTQIAPPPLPPTAGSTATLPTPTAALTQANNLTCTPGEPIVITGEGPPRAALLLFFGQRAVGGGSVSPAGHYAIPLIVGRERPGTYTVTVRVRGTTQVLREFTCAVPATPPPPPGRPT
ncbi:MAG TPA: hypothetical protein VGJ87_25545 [Roseiflexaceae bacterium]|jgi:cell wall-associated NlpC family hydrolase